jgi:hydrogenase/urease accessory protein HupE
MEGPLLKRLNHCHRQHQEPPLQCIELVHPLKGLQHLYVELVHPLKGAQHLYVALVQLKGAQHLYVKLVHPFKGAQHLYVILVHPLKGAQPLFYKMPLLLEELLSLSKHLLLTDH